MKVHSKNQLFYYFIFCFLFFISCKKTNEIEKKEMVTEVKESLSDKKKTIKELSKNEIVVSRLKEMKSAFENENKEGMLQFFDFPTKNFLFIRKNEEYRNKTAINNNKINAAYFLEHAKIKKESNHPSLYDLLVTLNLDSLKKSDSIEMDLEIKNDECYYMYKVEINDNFIILSYGSNSNQKYSDEGDCSETHTFLYFKIINDRIVFNKSEFAG